jgi:hypothetical protein
MVLVAVGNRGPGWDDCRGFPDPLKLPIIMSNPPRDRSEFWIRFVCAFVFFGFIIALGILKFADSWGITGSVAIWAVASLAISLYAAKIGDEAWYQLLDFLFGRGP